MLIITHHNYHFIIMPINYMDLIINPQVNTLLFFEGKVNIVKMNVLIELVEYLLSKF